MKGRDFVIYLDHSATTPLCDAAKKAIIEHLDDFGNPSSSYEFARKSRVIIEDARERIAKCINADPSEIYFTSGGSESNTWALSGRMSISTEIEHHSIVPMFESMKVESNGVMSYSYVRDQLEYFMKNYFLKPTICSCMYVNNELGTIQPVKEIADIAKKHNMLFHVDAVQALGHIPIDVKKIGCDMLSASGHKFGAPKGVGILYIKNGVYINSLIHGGKQERGKRGGTENVLFIASMAAALEDAVEHMDERNNYVKILRDKMLNKLLEIDGASLNGSYEHRTPSNINICFDGVPGARLVAMCDLYGICISSGSACNEGQTTPSHVLKAIGLSDEDALNSIRITIGHENTEEEIDKATDIITKLVKRIRDEKEN